MKNNFHKKDRKAFTIVELVIVIAVIAILAAVLIPTFANIIKKTNLNADKQAVREMNMALAADEASYGYGRNVNVEDAMYVLAQAGYNTDNWTCLTEGYQVYWYDIDNRCILYNSATGEIEYPEEYIGATTKVNGQDVLITLTDHVHIYNENHIKAQQFNMSLKSSVTTGADGKIASTGISGSGDNATYSITSTTTTIGGQTLSSVTSSSVNNLKALASSSTQEIIKSSLGVDKDKLNDTNVYMYATKESISADPSSGAYASLQISSVGVEPTLVNSSEVKENLYYLSIVNNGGSAEQLTSAKKAAAQYIYNIFDQITEGKIEDNVAIIVAPGTELDCSLGGADWAPSKTFSGYFGNGGSGAPVVISNASVTEKTGYRSAISMSGIPSHGTVYYCVGWIDTLYGSATIENLTFKNINISRPASDAPALTDNNARKRNIVALIGGITDGLPESGGVEANVVIRNVNVEGGQITGLSCVGGIVGYIGASNKTRCMSGSVLIENCNVSATLTSEYVDPGYSYGAVGGIVCYITRTIPGFSGCDASYGKPGAANPNNKDAAKITDLNKEGFNYFTEVTIKDCSFTGTLVGSNWINNLLGEAAQPSVRFVNSSGTINGVTQRPATQTQTTYDAFTAGTAAKIYTDSEWATSEYNKYK